MRYRKKATIFEAIQFNGNNYKECEKFIGEKNYDNTLNYPNVKNFSDKPVRVDVGDFIVKMGLNLVAVYDCNFFQNAFELVENEK